MSIVLHWRVQGAVRLAMRKELASIADENERDKAYLSMVEAVYERGKAENMAAMAEIDTVSDDSDPPDSFPHKLHSL